MNCLFCKIANNEVKSDTIFEDNIIKIILDINPSTNGHALIITKKHYNNIMEIDSETIIHIKEVIKEIYEELKQKLNCEGLTIITNTELGQTIKHLHFHLIPRYQNDSLNLIYNKEILVDTKQIYTTLKKEN